MIGLIVRLVVSAVVRAGKLASARICHPAFVHALIPAVVIALLALS